MDTKIRKHFTLSEDDINLLDQYAKEHNCSSSKALSLMINKTAKDEDTIKKVFDEFENRYKRQFFDPIRIRTGQIDKNMQIALSFLNSLAIRENLDYISIFTNPQYIIGEATDEINNRINHYKQKKDNKTKKENFESYSYDDIDIKGLL